MGPTSLKLATVTAILGLALAGCGSSSKGSSSSAAPAQGAAQFLAKGNAICQAGNAKRQRAGRALGSSPSPAQIRGYATKVFVPSIQSTLDQLRALKAPGGNEASWMALLNIAQRDLNRVKANPQLLRTDPTLFHNFAVPIHRYGLTECAKNA